MQINTILREDSNDYLCFEIIEIVSRCIEVSEKIVCS